MVIHNNPIELWVTSLLFYKFQTYNTAQNGVRGDAHSYPVMDLIKVENPDIMNCLIDQCKVDTILITDKQNHAMNITSRKENVPANLLKVIVTEPYTEFYPAPVYRSYSKQYFSTAKYLQLNMEQRERYLVRKVMILF